MSATQFLITVYHDQRDLTPWVTAVEVSQPAQCLYRQWSVTLAEFSELTPEGTWDIYGSYDPDAPTAEALVLGGTVPPDWERSPSVAAGNTPTLKVSGYDRVWLAQRRSPVDTLVLVPETDGARSAQQAILDYGQPVGSYAVLAGIATVRQAVETLAQRAGFNVSWSLSDYPMAAYVMPPTSSYWDACVELLRPFAPEVWYLRSTNTLVLCDPLAPRYGLGQQLALPAGLITSVSGQPVRRRRVRRVIFNIPAAR